MIWFIIIAFILGIFLAMGPDLVVRNIKRLNTAKTVADDVKFAGKISFWLYFSLLMVSCFCFMSDSFICREVSKGITKMEHRIDSLETVVSNQRDTIDLFRIVVEYHPTEKEND